MSLNNSGEFRSIKQINKEFEECFQDLLGTKSEIESCEKSLLSIERSSRDIINSIRTFSVSKLSESLQNVNEENGKELSLTDPAIVELKKSLAIWEDKCLNLPSNTLLRASIFANVNTYPKKMLLDNKELCQLIDQGNTAVEGYSILAKKVVGYAEQRGTLTNNIEDEIILRKKKIKNGFIAFFVMPMIALGVFVASKPELSQLYWQTLLELVNK